MRILHLTLHKEWFDKIAKREKPFEYREVKPYWTKRIYGREYDEIHFTNGYGPKRPFMRVKYHGFNFSIFQRKMVYALPVGEILEIRNWRP